MGEPMRFAGKVDGWYYALTVGVNVMLAWPLASFFADPAKEGAFISAVVCLLCLVLCDIFITPTLLRNYVEFDGKGNLLIVFGFQKATYPVSKIRRLRETSNPLASLAASFDRIELRIGYEELMIASRTRKNSSPRSSGGAPRSRSCEGPPFPSPGELRATRRPPHKNRLRES